MNELKTLKELELCFSNKLKQEAIKHIKYINENHCEECKNILLEGIDNQKDENSEQYNNLHEELDLEWDYQGFICPKCKKPKCRFGDIDWIKYFFNITEDDLK